jgi:hypothetical protein
MNGSLFGTIGVGVRLFVATHVDDVFLLAAFFADSRLSPRTIVIGQLTGIAALVAVSAVAALAAVAVPAPGLRSSVWCRCSWAYGGSGSCGAPSIAVTTKARSANTSRCSSDGVVGKSWASRVRSRSFDNRASGCRKVAWG